MIRKYKGGVLEFAEYDSMDDLKNKAREVLSGRIRGMILREDLVPAAVLIPLFKKNGQHHVLFTKRTETVEHHKGQISFPGGMKEEQDRDLEQTVLREVFEEIGLLGKDVDIVGELDDMETVTKFKVTPFVGFIPYPCEFAVCKEEIEELIEVPFSFFLDKSNCKEEEWFHDGMIRNIYVYQYDHYRIWGATARILKRFIDLF